MKKKELYHLDIKGISNSVGYLLFYNSYNHGEDSKMGTHKILPI